MTQPPLLIFGRTGQLAQELARAEPAAMFLGRDDADLAFPDACAAAIAAFRPVAVINAAAWTAVDRAESEEAAARVINADAPATMARACAALGIPFVHLSTDYVFNGARDAPFAPDNATGPLNAYGRTKLQGERGVREARGIHAIVRTSWVFSAHGANFVKSMLRMGAQRDRLSVVADQVGGPTPAAALAAACLVIARRLADDPSASGMYHFAGTPDVSWADFARVIMARAGLACEIDDIITDQYPTLARRPMNSRLDCRALEATFGVARPDWRVGLDQVLLELGEDM